MKQLSLLLCTLLLLLASCSRGHKVSTRQSDADYASRYPVERSDLAALFASDTVTDAEKDALRFLYAYMPLSDVADYSPDFHLANVRASLRAAELMPWGDSVPDREFRHFVLPVRVNNEDLDMSRPAMLAELAPRLEGLSMRDAILEVNHWCHEKATYRPSDGRTNSPFATMRSALGRCGEESTFTVAALRAVGIPARQVYTPRWAHTDDNHAWVEAWADGRWHFLGACEPEPVLDLGWFNEPASRGMLMNTKVFGRYDGPEEVLEASPLSTIINVTANYAPVRQVEVTVKDTDGKPVENAEVLFTIYNYAEFYPVARRHTDASGRASLLAGLGDMVIWASDGSKYGIAKASDGKEVVLVLDREGASATFDVLPVPPAASATLPHPDENLCAANDRRKAEEDSIRTAYTATFYDSERASALADRLGLDAAALTRVMENSRGNWLVVENFLLTAPADSLAKALGLLQAVTEKDLNDITPEVLADNLATPASASPLYVDYVLNPRVDTERLTPYKAFFDSVFTADERSAFAANPAKWAEWVSDSIADCGPWNPQRYRISPAAVWRERMADSRSRDIFFVAGARSFGVPARIDPVNGRTQYADASGAWQDVVFGAPLQGNAPRGTLVLEPELGRKGVEPGYYYHFTLSRIVDGLPVLQNFPEDARLSQFTGEGVTVDAGDYMLLTGRRMADGSVLAHAEFFTVRPDEKVTVPFVMSESKDGVSVIGSFNSEDTYYDTASESVRSLLSATGRGYYVLGLVRPGHEPSEHALNDIAASASAFEQWGRPMVILAADGSAAADINRSGRTLPSTVITGADIDGAIAAELIENLELPNSDLPVFVIADTFNRVVFLSQGYTIGLGDRLLDTAAKLE